jgi:hypothetical protein
MIGKMEPLTDETVRNLDRRLAQVAHNYMGPGASEISFSCQPTFLIKSLSGSDP